jgi:hypothetical protein
VAHHLSHNGTAKSIGLDMMINPDLIAMATLDYDVISSGWKSTMPNMAIVKDLLEKTKGRLLIMNTNDLMFSRKNNKLLQPEIDKQRKKMSEADRKRFEKALDTSNDKYIGIKIKV